MFLTPAVRAIVLINVLIFLVDSALNGQLVQQFALRSFLSPDFNPIQLVTHIFLHDGLGHIFSNMLGMVVFGPMLERVWGVRRFVFFYFFTGIGAALLFSGINYWEVADVYETVRNFRANPTPDGFVGFIDRHAGSIYTDEIDKFIDSFRAEPRNPLYTEGSVQIVNRVFSVQLRGLMVGASGALFGVMMGCALLFPNTEVIMPLLLFFPIKVKWLVIFYGAFELYSGIYQSQADNVAHFAHIGGMIFGFILVQFWGTQRQKFY
jgi:membrane associated rhomboid family serine protease